MPTDEGGNYVDENSDYSFQCCNCEYWFHDINLQGKYVPEIPGDLCTECLTTYKESLTVAQLKGSSLDNTDYDLMRKE